MTYYTRESDHSSHWQQKPNQTTSYYNYVYNNSPLNIPTGTHCEPASLRLTRRPYSNIYSVISKFEALDALSLPYHVPSLRPAPLHIPSIPRGPRVRGSTSQKEEQIHKVTNDDGMFKDYEGGGSFDFQGLEDIFQTKAVAVDSQPKASEPRELWKPPASDKSSSIMLRSGVWDPVSCLREAGSENSVRNTPPKHRHSMTVRDIISFYDGCKDFVYISGY